MTKNYRSLALLLLVLLGGRVHAQPEPLTPYIDEYTFLAGMVDVDNLDLDALLTRWRKFDLPKKTLAETQQLVGKLRAACLQAGVRRIYFTWNLTDALDAGPLWIVPGAKGD